MKNEVQFFNKQVVKYGPPDELRIEVKKTTKAYEIAKQSKLFKVPRIYDFDYQGGKVIYERLNFLPVSKIPWEQRKNIAIRLGECLAMIHDELYLSDSLKFFLPRPLSESDDLAFIHGDVSVDNVGIDIKTSELIIIDWQTTRHYGGQATYGPLYFDLFWFITNLIVRPYTRFIYSDPVTPVAKNFMEAYLSTTKHVIKPKNAIEYAQLFFPLEMRRSYKEILNNSKGRAIILFPWCKLILKNILQALKEEVW